MKILLWAPGGSDGDHYWGPGTFSYRLYKCNTEKTVKVSQAHGVVGLEGDREVFSEMAFIKPFRPSFIRQFIFTYSGCKWIKKNYRRFDVFHGLGAFESTFTPAYHFARRGKPAFIFLTGDQNAFVNNSRLSSIFGFPQRRRKRVNKITGYIANSESIVNMLLEIGVDEDRIFRIPNHANTVEFHPVDEAKKKKIRKNLGMADRFTVGFVGGLSGRKRPFELAKACSNLIKSGVPLNVVFLGPDREGGHCKTKIEEFITHEGVEDNFYFTDFSSSPSIYFQCTDVYALPSKAEGMAGALLEAMACGLPCIVTPISGSKDLVKEGYNGLYTNGQIDDIEVQVRRFYDDAEFRTAAGHRSREIIVSRYSSNKVLQQHLDLFRNAIR